VIDYDLIERLLERVDEETGSGSVLVFLPGVGEVTNLIERLSSHPRFAPRHGRHVLVPLHSQCNPVEQREAFKIPPEHVRKIVVATNVAETSVTVSLLLFPCGQLD
jgi:ATP-dependent RNA helicase DHX29